MSTLQQTARRMARLRRIPGFLAWNRLIFKREYPSLARNLFGLSFIHPLGLAPVLDRQASLLDACSSLGYAFSGILPGNTPVNEIVDRLSHRKSGILAGIELKAEGDSEEQAKRQILHTYSLLYDFADYFVVDINWQSGVSSLDDISDWEDVLNELLELRLCYEKYRPILLRLPPVQSDEQTYRALDFCRMNGIDGVIVTGIQKIKSVSDYTEHRYPIVGSGAVTTPSDAVALLQAGASLLEIAQGIPGHCRTTARRILQALDNPTPKQ